VDNILWPLISCAGAVAVVFIGYWGIDRKDRKPFRVMVAVAVALASIAASAVQQRQTTNQLDQLQASVNGAGYAFLRIGILPGNALALDLDRDSGESLIREVSFTCSDNDLFWVLLGQHVPDDVAHERATFGTEFGTLTPHMGRSLGRLNVDGRNRLTLQCYVRSLNTTVHQMFYAWKVNGEWRVAANASRPDGKGGRIEFMKAENLPDEFMRLPPSHEAAELSSQ